MGQKSIVLITVDCLRADHVGFMGYSRGVTPFLDSLARESIVLTGAMAAGVPTYFSFPAILASRYPLGLGRDILGVAPHEPTVATALQDAGYRTAAFLAGNPYLSHRSGYHQGFDEFHDFVDSAALEGSTAPNTAISQSPSNLNRRIKAASGRTHMTAALYDELYFWYGQAVSAHQNYSMDQLRRYPAADVVIDQACSWLSHLGDEGFLLWLHLMDPHHPYYPPLEALSSVGASRMTARHARFLNSCWNRGEIAPHRLQRYREQILSLYDAGVYWVDKQISRLVHALQQSRHWDETVFAVTADHGEEFIEHGARYHYPENLPEQLIHVPLLLRAPELPGMRLQELFSLIHLAPTLLQAVDVRVPDSFQGRSRWEQITTANLPSEPTITECVEACNNPSRAEQRMRPRLIAVRHKEYKLVIRFGDGRDRFYDLKNDPGEHSPLPMGVLTQERVRLLKVARAHLQKTREDRNAEFVISAHLRDLQQSIPAKRDSAAASRAPA
jgi:arylsulfatase A-like enzyme